MAGPPKVQSSDLASLPLDLGQETEVKPKVRSLDLLPYLNTAIDESGEQQKAIAADLEVDPSYLRRMRLGDKPWSLRHLAALPHAIRVVFLSLWAEADGVPLTAINTLRAMADALEEQGRLALLGTVPRAGPAAKMSLQENGRAEDTAGKADAK